MDDDIKYLELLTIFHFIFGGIIALIACIPLVSVILGTVIATASSNSGIASGTYAGIFIAIAGVFGSLLGWAVAVVIFLVGVKLKKYKSRIFCIAVAGFECIIFPIGTVLGILTIAILTKNSVIKRFDSPNYSHFASTHR